MSLNNPEALTQLMGKLSPEKQQLLSQLMGGAKGGGM